jgi:hypothetical protein
MTDRTLNPLKMTQVGHIPELYYSNELLFGSGCLVNIMITFVCVSACELILTPASFCIICINN